MRLQLEKFLTRLRAAKNYSPHTLRAYRADLESFAAKFPDVNAADLDRVHVRRHLSELQSGDSSRATVLRKASALRSFVKFLRAEGELKRDPFLGVPLPKRTRSLPKFLTEAEMEEILSAPVSSGDSGSERDRAMIELLYSSGLRRTEISTINVGDLDILSGTVRVFGKGSKERIVPVGKEALSRLRNYLRSRGGPADREPLFSNLRGARLSSEGVAFVVRRWVKRSSLLKKVTPHVFRHSFATHLLNHGCNIREVQEMLGHSDLNTTQIYTHISLQKLQEVYKGAHPRSS
ncbi:MAG: site-specific tyrosine recombinase/integron integrase [Elusimicrobiota bacterium]